MGEIMMYASSVVLFFLFIVLIHTAQEWKNHEACKPEEGDKTCRNCRNRYNQEWESPCRTCVDRKDPSRKYNWEAEK